MFSRGFTLFRVRGIPVKLHITLLIVLPYLAFVTSYQYAAIAKALGVPSGQFLVPPLVWGAILAVGLFVSVLLHELAHAFVASRRGGHVQSITLMMLGGVTQIDREVPPEKEAWMAFAGPLTSLVIAVVSYGVARLFYASQGLFVALVSFAAMNLLLAVFNLLPAFPMDGGRVLRGLLSRRLGRARATRIAAGLGRALAVAFGVFAIITFNWILGLIAIFIWFGASAEQRHIEGQLVLRGMHVSDLMNPRLGDALADEPPGELAERMLREHVVAARVTDARDPAHRTLGIITIDDLSAKRETVRASMRTNLPRMHPGDDAGKAMGALASAQASAIEVINDAGEIVGLVLPADLQRALALRAIRQE
jgi:Zn-dependent protease